MVGAEQGIRAGLKRAFLVHYPNGLTQLIPYGPGWAFQRRARDRQDMLREAQEAVERHGGRIEEVERE